MQNWEAAAQCKREKQHKTRNRFEGKRFSYTLGHLRQLQMHSDATGSGPSQPLHADEAGDTATARQLP